MGDDGFTMPFRQQNLPYIYEQKRRRKTRNTGGPAYDDYDMYLQAGSRRLGRRRGLEQVGFWRRILEHPPTTLVAATSEDKILAAQPLKVPTMLVDSCGIRNNYGAMAVYKAIKRRHRQ